MGFFDFLASLFGGGAKMAVQLDSERVPEGGILSGTATLTGAPKDVTVTDIKVRLLYVHVEQQEDSPLPNIDTRVLVDEKIAENVDLPANENMSFDFSFTIPPGTEPTAHNVSYNVVVAADIPSMKDPSDKVDLEVIEGAGGEYANSLTAEGLYQRWPGLKSDDADELADTLGKMRWEHEEGDPENDLTVAEPLLQKLIKRNDHTPVRIAAFQTWANIVSEHLRTEHVQLMGKLLDSAQDDKELLLAIIRGMGPTVDLGGDKLLLPFLEHDDAEVRLAAVGALDWGRGNKSQTDAILPLLDDEDPAVRAAAVSALGDVKDNPQVARKIIEVALRDDQPQVISQALSATALLWTRDERWEEAAPVYEKAREHDSPEVRKSYINWISWPARRMDVSDHMEALLVDESDTVAEAMAFEFCNLLRDGKLPDHDDYVEICVRTTKDGRSDKIKANALGALDEFMEPEEVAKVYRELLSGETSYDLQWGMVQGIKFTTEPALKAVLKEMSDSDYPRVAKAAKDAYEADYS